MTGVFSHVREILHVPWPTGQPYRLFDERAGELGPYYVAFGHEGIFSDLDSERTLGRSGERHPIEILKFGLDQHARWRRTGDERARERFLEQAEWAAAAQRETSGVRGSYEFPFASKRYGCAAGFRSATAQGQAISLLLRANQATGNAMFLDRAIEAAIPLAVDLRDGGVLWQIGDDLIFEAVAGMVPSHILCGWICALWALFELSHTTKLKHVTQLYRRSLSTLEKHLPSYDSGTWSYGDLLTTPAGFRRVATLRRHLLHVAQLNVLVSMTKRELFAVVAERWRGYSASLEGRLQGWANGLFPGLLLLDPLAVPSDARR